MPEPPFSPPLPVPGSYQGPMWRAISVFRFVALAYVVVLAFRNLPQYAHPPVAIVALLVMAGWSGFTAYAYARRRLRRWPLLVADLAVALGVLVVSPWAIGRDALGQGVPTLGIAWLAAPVLAWAVWGGRRRGVLAALALGGTDLAVRERLTESSFTGAMLMLLAGIAVGHVARLGAEAEQRSRRAIELAAATRERERLARGIHDSVLQVLAMVQRRGADLGGEAAELARLAGEQEAALRTLIATGSPPVGAGAGLGPGARSGSDVVAGADGTSDADDAGGARTDLCATIQGYARAEVSVAVPATPVLLPPPVATEIGAATGAALDNVRRHGGGRAWILVEEEAGAVTVSIRDEGPGIAPGRLVEAAAQGRLGVAQSIRGRIADLGGEVRISSVPDQGTEVELRIPRQGWPD